jgi:hypothetical protein
MKSLLRTGILCVACAASLLGDVTFNQSVKFTGGTMVETMRRMASNPMLGRFGGGAMKNAFTDQSYTVYVKGSKMARSGETLSFIYDLDAGTMTTLDNEKHTYTVQTFDEMRQRFEQMQQRMGHGQPNIDFDVKVDKTEQTRSIDGQTATETVITLTAKASQSNDSRGNGGQMVVKVDAWLVPSMPATQELVDFQKKLAAKYAYAFAGFSPSMGAAGSGMSAAMKQLQNLDGYPVLTDMSVSGVSSPMAQMSGENNPNAPFMQTETQSSNFVTGPVDDSKFAVPAGYKEQQMRGR